MGPLELVEMRSPYPGCSTASGLPSCRSTANGLPGPGLFYPRDLNAKAGRQPVEVSPELCSCSHSHAKAEIIGRTRDPQSTSGQQTQPLSFTLGTSRCSFLFTSSDLRRSFLAVSRSSFSSVTWAERAARRFSIWLYSCLSMTSWRSITLARSSSWLRGSLSGKGSLRQPCFEREGTQHFWAIGEVKTAFCTLGAHKTLTATQTYMVCW